MNKFHGVFARPLRPPATTEQQRRQSVMKHKPYASMVLRATGMQLNVKVYVPHRPNVYAAG